MGEKKLFLELMRSNLDHFLKRRAVVLFRTDTSLIYIYLIGQMRSNSNEGRLYLCDLRLERVEEMNRRLTSKGTVNKTIH